MTSDERNMLTDLANKIAQTPPPPKDPEAEDFIRTKIGSRPDALYLMTQTVLIQNLALQHAQQQIQELQRGSGSGQISSGSSSFIGQQQAPRASGYGQGQSFGPPPPQYAPPSPGGPSPSAGNPSGAPSFLKGAAQTAAGVAAGALAFEGIQHLFSHPGYGGGGGFFGGGGIGGYAPPVEETVVNNYYDNAPGDRGGDYGGDYGDTRDDYQAADDASNVDDSSYNDNAGFDDGGGFDDNSGGDSFV
jgi:hypothetical protein